MRESGCALRQVILWDFDGTLAIREGGWTGALSDLLAVHAPDVAVTPDQIRPFLQAGFPWHEPHTPHTHLNDDPAMWWRALDPIFVNAFEGLGVARKRAVDLARLVRAQYLAPAAWRLFDDVLPALCALAEHGWQQMIVSNHVPELPQIVSELGLDNMFAAIINSATIGYEKPHPAIYQCALQMAGNADPIWMIGDSYNADVLGAQAAGIPAILVRKPHPQAPYVCADLPAALAIIEQY